MEETFHLFMGTVDECFRDFVSQIHDYLTISEMPIYGFHANPESGEQSVY